MYACTPSLSRQNNVKGVDDTWNVTKNGQKNVQEESTGASNFKENTQRWQENRNNDLDDVAANHDVLC